MTDVNESSFYKARAEQLDEDLAREIRHNSPGNREAAAKRIVLMRAAYALRDKWRTPGQKVDGDDFFAAIHALSEAVDAYDAYCHGVRP